MQQSQGVFAVPEMSTDARLRVFRRIFNFKTAGAFEGLEVDAYVVFTERYALVFDTLLCPEDTAAMMSMVHSELAGRQVLVVNSHADWDHAWGNGYFTGAHAAPIIAHDYGLLRLRSEAARVELADFQRRDPTFANVVLVPPTITFDSSLTIADGDLTIELLPTPGHQRDHLAAWIPQLRLLLAFDTVEKPLPCLENAASVPALFATLERLLALGAERVLCSHGKTTTPQQVQANLAYLRELERRCQALLQHHQPTLQELETPSILIHYTLDDVVAGESENIDRTFYGWAHDNNVRAVLQWLLGQRTSAEAARDG